MKLGELGLALALTQVPDATSVFGDQVVTLFMQYMGQVPLGNCLQTPIMCNVGVARA